MALERLPQSRCSAPSLSQHPVDGVGIEQPTVVGFSECAADIGQLRLGGVIEQCLGNCRDWEAAVAGVVEVGSPVDDDSIRSANASWGAELDNRWLVGD
jgi:hypothetical protein